MPRFRDELELMAAENAETFGRAGNVTLRRRTFGAGAFSATTQTSSPTTSEHVIRAVLRPTAKRHAAAGGAAAEARFAERVYEVAWNDDGAAADGAVNLSEVLSSPEDLAEGWILVDGTRELELRRATFEGDDAILVLTCADTD